ncbi:hypothetical protein ACBI99_16310 [Nonomuraea sp. ATR24]|uniref:hypothetical protein n=1 Tax=Nonomuraea sp. ATR24 TaxID=1676744 RepID=UPI0035C04889
MAGAIASLGGVTGTLLGTLVPLIPPFFPLLVIGLFLLRAWKSFLVGLLAMAVAVPAYAGILESLRVGWESAANLWHVLFTPGKRALVWPSVWPTLIFAGLVVTFLVFDRFSGWRERVRANFLWVDQIREERQGEGNDAENEQGSASEGEVDQPLPTKVGAFVGHSFEALIKGMFAAVLSVFTFASITHIYHVPYDYSTIKETVRKPWLPLEVIETKTFRYVGYSIAVKDGWHAILVDGDRALHYVQAADVTDRQICKKASDPLSQPTPIVDFSGDRTPIWKVCPVISGG